MGSLEPWAAAAAYRDAYTRVYTFIKYCAEEKQVHGTE